jgi:hypothetical protein
MATQFPIFAHPVRSLLAGAGVLALASTVYFGAHSYADFQEYAANHDVEIHVARIPIKNLEELNSKSDAVVLGRVVGTGGTHFILPEAHQPQAFTRDTKIPAGVSPEKVAAAQGSYAPPSRAQGGLITPPPGIPTTDYNFEVTQVLRGNVAQGSKITVNQLGGVIHMDIAPGVPSVTRTLFAEHDATMVQGQEQVLFLTKGTDGVFRATGGPDGRFKLDARKTLEPVDGESLVGQSLKGQTLEDLRGKVGSNNNNNKLVREGGR